MRQVWRRAVWKLQRSPHQQPRDELEAASSLKDVHVGRAGSDGVADLHSAPSAAEMGWPVMPHSSPEGPNSGNGMAIFIYVPAVSCKMLTLM